ncbi:MAG TPA: cyclase family protein, partial [Dehalococcoidia bacterium]|nr:cyclase family protein [Dehalococcoidia bacterium]
MSNPVPRYEDLPLIEQTGERHAWDVFGREDNVGALNFVGPEQIIKAARLVRQGKVISLSLPLDLPNPPLAVGTSRRKYDHHVIVTRGGRDDYVDQFYMQFSSQWDSLRHVRYREYGYWTGLQEEDLNSSERLGIHHWAERGIVGRGVLIDLPAHFARLNHPPLDPRQRFAVDGPLIEEIAGAQNVRLEPGDILLLRTGWLEWYLSLSEAEREDLPEEYERSGGIACPGLDATQATAAWIWDHRIAACAGDNLALEALPVDRAAGFQHRRLIPLLGVAVGEFFDFEKLAADCAADGVYECLFVAAPL